MDELRRFGGVRGGGGRGEFPSPNPARGAGGGAGGGTAGGRGRGGRGAGGGGRTSSQGPLILFLKRWINMKVTCGGRPADPAAARRCLTTI